MARLASNDMPAEQRQEWLSSLKIGDIVVTEQYSVWRGHSVSTHKVKNITKAGRVRLDNDVLLNDNGHYHKYVHYSSVDYFILPYDDEAKALIKLHDSRARIGWMFDNVDMDKLSQEDLDALRTILEPAIKEVKRNG